ncbi:MAG: FecR domain-containing protein [Acidobacteriaceae bacterium]|nr:FecR domain-containing protein [Acidobacteriaceae bacterium]
MVLDVYLPIAFMFCRPYALRLAGILALACVWPNYAQFARVPQEPGAGQYPSYSNSPYDSGSTPNEAPSDPAADQQHGVARISIVQGDVNVRRGDTSELVAAVVNAPLMAQDRLQTSSGSRAEVELDAANLIRLAPDTDLGLADLQYGHFQVQLGAGTIIYRVLRPSQSQGEVDTPSIALRALGEGVYRMAVLPDGTTQIDVRAGAAEIAGPRGSERIDAGHSVLVRGNPANPEFQEIQPPMRDQFDDWSETRDRELLPAQGYGYVSPDISGAEDLDANGSWVPSQYGQVWVPRTAVENWAPYSYGQWTWEPYYGWTWVDYAPWGWAPYHYGRWFWNGGYGWCWWPGARLSAHFWSPALVGFFGWRNGSIGWVALAPYERFHPWWGRGVYGGYHSYGPGGFDGLRNVGVWGAYRNAAFRGGAVYAGSGGFSGPRQRFGFVTREQLGSASFINGSVPVTPNRASYLFTNRQAVANSKLASVSNLRFFQYGRSQSGQPLNAQRAYGQTGYPGRNSGVGGTSGTRGSANGWQRFGDPGAAVNGYRQGFTGGAGENGWHQFGRPQGVYPPPTSGTGRLEGSRPMPSYRQPPSYNSMSPYRGNFGNSPYGGSAAPRFTPPSQPHYSAPSTPRYSAPSSSRGGSGGSFRGGAPSRSGGGQHSSSGGSRHGR